MRWDRSRGPDPSLGDFGEDRRAWASLDEAVIRTNVTLPLSIWRKRSTVSSGRFGMAVFEWLTRHYANFTARPREVKASLDLSSTGSALTQAAF